MLSKQCARCGNLSYSASTRGPWLCPYCGLDLNPTERDTNDHMTKEGEKAHDKDQDPSRSGNPVRENRD